MDTEHLGITLKIKTKLEKYPDEFSIDDINKGLVQPIEVIEGEENFIPTREQLEFLKSNGLQI